MLCRVVRKNFIHNLLRRFSTEKCEVTSLYNFHIENGGKMVNFGGFLLPVQYNDLSITASHLHTRQKTSLFDVSHMLQTEIKGDDCIKYLESVITADLQGLKNNSSTLTVFTNDQGGILDDLIVTKINDDHLYVVSNAAMREQDQGILLNALDKHKKSNPKSKISVQFFEPSARSLIALQGPTSAQVLQKITNINLADLYFMTSSEAMVFDVGAIRITRCGYTGEDGFEISIPSIKAIDVAKGILNNEDVKLAGLGARDSLRLEAGLCLYGSDITSNTTPVEAGLTWLIAKRRRERADFPGADVILRQISEGAKIKRVGLIVSEGGPPARHGAKIFDENGQIELGEVTSGCPSPSLNKNIAMGYVPTSFSKIGTKLQVKVREKLYGAVISKMPFVPARYYTKPK